MDISKINRTIAGLETFIDCYERTAKVLDFWRARQKTHPEDSAWIEDLINIIYEDFFLGLARDPKHLETVTKRAEVMVELEKKK